MPLKKMPLFFLRLFLVSIFLSTAVSWASNNFDHSHKLWDAWLKDHVTMTGPISTVNYNKAKQNSKTLTVYLSEVKSVTKPQFDAFNDNEKLAFLINAYNAFTVQLIVDNYPVKSIKDLGGLFSSPWKKKFFKLFEEEQHLDGIEHGMIREKFQEPRIHFSVVCASIGCPQLRNEAFVSSKLESQFAEGAKNFLSDSARNRYDATEKKLYLSMIFKWYGDDFKKKHGSVQAFISEIMAKNPTEKAEMAKAEMSFLEYNWSLNETH